VRGELDPSVWPRKEGGKGKRIADLNEAFEKKKKKKKRGHNFFYSKKELKSLRQVFARGKNTS